VSPEGCTYEHALKFLFKASNNEAKYEALLTGMKICNILGVEYLKALSDFQLVVSQVMGEYEACDTTRIACSAKVTEKASMFKKFKIEHVHR